ncbi:hypothetical protein, partial [Accumulibacter sp.]|uniref:hypothetical protein n=1 Tax=Accumulibacter sp. TaxID=2053492 RepID=UPI002C82C168
LRRGYVCRNQAGFFAIFDAAPLPRQTVSNAQRRALIRQTTTVSAYFGGIVGQPPIPDLEFCRAIPLQQLRTDEPARSVLMATA